MPHAIQIRQTGGPEVLNWTAVDVGEPGSGQVRLRQAAAGPIDPIAHRFAVADRISCRSEHAPFLFQVLHRAT